MFSLLSADLKLSNIRSLIKLLNLLFIHYIIIKNE